MKLLLTAALAALTLALAPTAAAGTYPVESTYPQGGSYPAGSSGYDHAGSYPGGPGQTSEAFVNTDTAATE